MVGDGPQHHVFDILETTTAGDIMKAMAEKVSAFL